MDFKVRSRKIILFSCLVVIAVQHVSKAEAFVYTPDYNHPYPKAISDLKEAIVKGFGFQSDDLKITDFNLRDAMVGKSMQYEFDIEIDNKVLPFKLLEDVSRWEYVDLPIFQTVPHFGTGEEKGLADRKLIDNQTPVLAPFQLAGPMELWILDAKDMRISLPNDVDAGELKKVILADGAVVTVKGARSVSLRHPIELPLPLNRSTTGFASGLLTLAEYLRNAVRTENGPLLSLRIVGPTSLTSPTSSSSSSTNKLKLKRLAPGLVELSSASKKNAMESDPKAQSPIDIQGRATTLLAPDRFSTLWPITSITGANSRLMGFEALLYSVLGKKANEKGSFKLVKADASAQTFVKIGFAVEKKVKESDLVGFPEWRTKPQNMRMHFEVLAKVDGNKVVPERVLPVEPVMAEDSFTVDALVGNVSMSKVPIVHQPPNPFTL